MTNIPALTAEMNALAAAAADIDWLKIAKGVQVKIAEAVANGGVVTYQVNGRSVTRSVAELREILKVAKSEQADAAGGVIVQLGEFGS
jgi:hypothetical protein